MVTAQSRRMRRCRVAVATCNSLACPEGYVRKPGSQDTPCTSAAACSLKEDLLRCCYGPQLIAPPHPHISQLIAPPNTVAESIQSLSCRSACSLLVDILPIPVPSCAIVRVGSSSSGSKTVANPTRFACPATVASCTDPSGQGHSCWLGDVGGSEIFSVTQDATAGTLTVQSEGPWSWDLRFRCCKGMEWNAGAGHQRCSMSLSTFCLLSLSLRS